MVGKNKWNCGRFSPLNNLFLCQPISNSCPIYETWKNMCLDMVLLPMSQEICLMQSQRLCSFRKWCLLYQFSEHTSVPGVILLNKCLSISTGSTVYILYMYTCVYIHICTAYLGYIFGTHTHISHVVDRTSSNSD